MTEDPEPPKAEPEVAAPEAAEPAPEPAPPAPPAPRRWLRLAILGGVAAIGVVVLIVIARSRGTARELGEAPTTSDGGAAIRAPQPPQLPSEARGLRLTGFVVDGTNTPVVGAEVSAELEKGLPVGAGSGSAGSAAGSGSGSAAPATIIAPATGSDGRFVLDTQVAGRYRVRVTGPGLLPAELRYVPVPSDEARIVVARRVTIEGTVVDGKTLVANATVGVRGEAIGGGIEVKTDTSGAFKLADLPEGRYQVYAWKDTLAARAMRVNRLGAGPFPQVELSLEAASIVVGRVVDREEGTGLRAAIELRPSGDDQAPRYARTADDGTFRIEGVPNGRWIADAFSPGYVTLGGVELDAGKGIPELALERGGVLAGRVIDRAGKPIANATVRALTGSSNAQQGQQAQQSQEHSAAVDQDRLRRFSGRIAAPALVVGTGGAADPQLLPRGELGVLVGPIPPIPPAGAQVARPTSVIADTASGGGLLGEPAPLLASDDKRASIWVTGSDGRYRIAGLSRGKHVVLAVAPTFAEGRAKPVAVELRQVIPDVDVTLGPGTMIVGRVTDQHGVKVVGAQVHAAPEVGAPLDAFTDDEGMYRLGPVTGTVVLTANAFGHADIKRTLEIAISPDRVGSTAAPDDRREDLVLVVADAVLAGTLDDTTGAPVANAHVEVIGGAGAGRHAVVGADGTFAIDMLPAGPLRVRVTHPHYPAVELDATASKGERVKVRLRMPLGGAVEGVLLDGAGGAQLGGVVINGYGPNGATADATSDTTGRWKLGPLRPGRWKLTIEQSGFLTTSRELEVPVSRTPGATSLHDIRFDLAKGALVGGTVRDARGRRANGVEVRVQAASGQGPTATGTTDTQGEFRIRDAPTGEITITVTSGDVRGVTKVTVRPGDEVLGLTVELQ